MEISDNYKIHNPVNFWCQLVGIRPIELRERIVRYNSILSFYIFHEENGKHNRLHFHALINNEKVASIYLDNFEIDYLNGKVKQSDKKNIAEWVENNVDALKKIRERPDGKFDIPFNAFTI